jgi:pantothenate kinase
MHQSFNGFYDFGIFLDIDKDLQRKRILKRNAPEFAKRFFEEWIPLEDKYFSATNIKERADLLFTIEDK